MNISRFFKTILMIDFIGGLNNYLVIGVGNIVGWGDRFVQEMKRYRVND